MAAASERAEVSAPRRGRFAPTPSGPLHFGSLVAAVGSFLEARGQGGEWLVRMDDLDPPRVVPGAADSILRTLEAFGFEWHGEVMRQSKRQDAYEAAFHKLKTYRCACSRSALITAPCRCADTFPEGHTVHSWRVAVPLEPICWHDRLHGPQCDSGGDFTIRRGDGIFAYHLAVVVDDAAQGITDVVRGADLLDCTAHQILLQRLLGCATPGYLHLPIARNAQGEKLSKQTKAAAISPRGCPKELAAALRLLGQAVPPGLNSLNEIWTWARAEWHPERIPA